VNKHLAQGTLLNQRASVVKVPLGERLLRVLLELEGSPLRFARFAREDANLARRTPQDQGLRLTNEEQSPLGRLASGLQAAGHRFSLTSATWCAPCGPSKGVNGFGTGKKDCALGEAMSVQHRSLRHGRGAIAKYQRNAVMARELDTTQVSGRCNGTLPACREGRTGTAGAPLAERILKDREDRDRSRRAEASSPYTRETEPLLEAQDRRSDGSPPVRSRFADKSGTPTHSPFEKGNSSAGGNRRDGTRPPFHKCLSSVSGRCSGRAELRSGAVDRGRGRNRSASVYGKQRGAGQVVRAAGPWTLEK